MSFDPIALRFLLYWSIFLAGAFAVSAIVNILTGKNFIPRLWIWIPIVGFVFASISFGRWAFFTLTAAVFVISFWEISRMDGGGGITRHILSLSLALPWFVLVQVRQLPFWIPVAMFLFLTSALYLGLVMKKGDRRNLFFLALILGTGFSFWILLDRRGGFRLVLFVFSVTAINDILSFLLGKKLGKLRLFPRISPEKTLAGYLGGGLCAVITAHVFRFAVPELNTFQVTVAALLLSLSGSAGDLLASRIKRIYGIKDFSPMLGLMGGMLDRCDSLLSTGWVFACLFVYLL
jgi:CDP-diglyceride synthetase